MTTAIVLTVSRQGQRSRGLGHNEIDNMQLRTNGLLYTVELYCIIN